MERLFTLLILVFQAKASKNKAKTTATNVWFSTILYKFDTMQSNIH